MQKERELNDFSAKFKRSELKFNRDIKEIKIAEEKAKVQLKDERTKHDKTTKTLIECKEQNMVIQKRMIELKEEKDKEIDSVRGQYNNIKNEVRSYERILPTLTFMNKLGAGYDQLPIYEELFLNCKDRAEKCIELEKKFDDYRKEIESKIEIQNGVEKSLKVKNGEMARQVEDDLIKILDLESRITTISMERDEVISKLQYIEEEYVCANESVDELTDENKSLHDKINELIKLFENELQEKEDEVHKRIEEEFKKSEEAIEVMRRDYENKEHSHLEQLAIFEEEEHRLMEKIREDKEVYEESTKDINNMNEKLKNEVEFERIERNKVEESMKELREKMKPTFEENERLKEELKEMMKSLEKVSLEKRGDEDKDIEREDVEISRENNEYEKKYWIKKSQELEGEVLRLKEKNCEYENRIETLNEEIEEMNSKYGERLIGNLMEIEGLSERDKIRSRTNTCDFTEIETVVEESLDLNKKEVEVSSLELQDKVSCLEYKVKVSEERIRELNEKIEENEEAYLLILGEKQKIEQMYIQNVKENNKNRESVTLFKSQNKELEKTLKEYQKMLENKESVTREVKNKDKDGSVNVKEILEKHTDQINRMLVDQKNACLELEERMKIIEELKKEVNENQKDRERLGDNLKEKSRENEILRDLLENERKEKSLLTASSLESLCSQVSQEDEGYIKEFELQAGEMQGKIISLEREVSNLRVEIEELREKNDQKVFDLEEEMKYYIEEIIDMKFKVANAEMKASEKVHLYNQLKKKMNVK